MKQFYCNIRRKSAVFGFLFFFFLPYSIVMAKDMSTMLMESTFKLEGEGPGDSTVSGTAFIVGRPRSPKDSGGYPVLVTAAHVLNNIQSDIAKLILRKKKKDETWEKIPYPIKIRDNGKPLWVHHNEVDVAVMYIELPKYIRKDTTVLLPSTNLLADDKILEDFEIHPGDEIMCLGYPLGKQEGHFGFPILQSGRIATYPLLPTKQIKTFICDLKISKGYSGGPVYFVESGRTYKGGLHVNTIQFIAGLISTIPITQKELDRLYEEEKRFYFGFARAIHASLIKETIDKLPKIE